MALPDEIRQRIEERLAELAPLVAEYNQLRGMQEGIAEGATADTPHDLKSPKRRYSSATRRRQVWELVLETPDIRVKDLAERLGLSVPRVVEIVNELENDGSVKRSDDGVVVCGDLR